MRIYNSYITIIAVLFFLTTIILVAMGQSALEFYFALYVIEALAVTEIYAFFSARARRGLGLVSIILLCGFFVILSFGILRILS